MFHIYFSDRDDFSPSKKQRTEKIASAEYTEEASMDAIKEGEIVA
jgi:hypothetical protein